MVLAISAFGGPQAHMALFFETLVEKRGYLSEKDLIELHALCQMLPGPTSTQTITALGFKIGGPNLAYLTLLVWMMPAVTIMTLTGLLVSYFQESNISLNFTRFIQPMAVGFVAYAAYMISVKVVHSKTGVAIMVVAAVVSFFVRSPFAFPIILLVSGIITGLKYKRQPIEEKEKLTIQWSNFLLWAGVLVFAAILGGITNVLPIRLFENFYRNGSLIFGGGQVLIPLLYTEFVDFKQYLSSQEFLSGYAMVQSIPGPVFSFCAYIGVLSMRDFGVGGEIVGAFSAALGIFLPGTFLIFFIVRFWEGLKKYRVVKASLEGVNAASSGMVAAAAVLMFQPLDSTVLNFALTIGTFSLLLFTRIPAPLVILAGLAAGFIL